MDMNGATYAVRRSRPSERGRWVICGNCRPNDVRRDGFLTKWGAMRLAREWQHKNDAAQRMYPV